MPFQKRNPGRPARQVAEGNRWCGGCQAEHPIAEFSGKERTCRQAKYLNHILRRYGLSKEQYDEWFDLIRGVCPICQTRKATYVDHDHKTGKARGILCQPCNTALGHFMEDEAIFNRALQYLEVGIAIARNPVPEQESK